MEIEIGLMDRKTASLLSLCQKAGKLVSGEVACEKALRSGTAELIFISIDASERTKKKFVNKSFYYKVACHICFGKEELSNCIGKNNRAVVAVTDKGFAKALLERKVLN